MGVKEKNIYEMELPQLYREGIITYVPSVDGDPDDLKMHKLGYGKERRDKIMKLYWIEHLKYNLENVWDESEEDEKKSVIQAIQDMIEEYNSMHG